MWWWGAGERDRVPDAPAVIEAGKPYCDISFMPEDAIESMPWPGAGRDGGCGLAARRRG